MLRTRLTAARDRIERMRRWKLTDRKCVTILRHAVEDVKVAKRLLDEPGVDTKPHTLHAVDVLLQFAEVRLCEVKDAIDAGST